jgi:hypothetical protein
MSVEQFFAALCFGIAVGFIFGVVVALLQNN